MTACSHAGGDVGARTWSQRARRDAIEARGAEAPIILAAIDLDAMDEAAAKAIRAALKSLLAAAPGARLAVLNVLKLARITLDRALDSTGANKHAARLVEAGRFAKPLGLSEHQVSFHVIEAVDPANAILDYVARNRVDHVVMGARAPSARKALLGSVSAEVAAKAPCTVTIVRRRGS